MPKTYLFRPRGKGFAFQVTVPKDLRGKFKSERTGRPRSKVVVGLDTDSEVEAKRKAAALAVEWSRRFERARLNAELTLGEIDDFAREAYAAWLAGLEATMQRAEPDAKRLFQFSLQATIQDLKRYLEDAHTPWSRAEDFDAPDLSGRKLAAEIARIRVRVGITLDPTSETYRILAQALVRARLAAAEGRQRAANGMPSEAPATFLGADGIDPLTLRPKQFTRPFLVRETAAHGPWSLFEQWISAAKPAPSTVNRWRAVFLGLQARFGANLITEHDARAWVSGLVGESRSAATVHDVWLIGARAVYSWATEHRLVEDNPFAKVKITVPKQPVTRDRAFTTAEAATILKAASAIKVKSPFTAALRWCPWLAAYSGARMGELTQLRAEDVKQIDGIWCMTLTPDAGTTKTKRFRNVPLHAHLIKLGFLTYASGRDGPLFYNPNGEAKETDASNPQRPRAVKCRERLAAWSRQLVSDKGVAPNHAWRHTWKTVAARAGISDGLSDAITGHASLTVAGRYLHPTVADMAKALRKFPRYQ